MDLITEVPADAYQTILNNQQAVFRLYHRELDPFQADYINVFGRVYVDEINRRILRFITTASQLDVSQAQKKLDATRSTIYTLRTILQECAGQPDRPVTCDREKLHQYLQTLDRNIDEFTQTTDRTLTLADAVEEGLAGSEPSAVQPQPNLVEEANSLANVGETVQDYRDALETLTRLETDLDQMESKLNLFLDIDPIILISPFRAEVQNVSLVPIKVTDYFSPAVIILLLQHLTVTFAALSMVRERRLGAMELFYVSPLSPLETLLGKYLSYLTFGGVVASVLVALVALALGAPVLGSWLNVALVILGVLFTSLGIGFVISLVSKTDTEAVQYAMIILLTSVFFSGFLLGLQTLWAPVRIISWMLPATYGIALLREIMLRGDPPTANVFIQLVTIGLGLFIVAWYLLRRSMTQS
ncbi:MAG: ABC transporter permease [Chloroflexi bacterium]|nr:MAG: ABC transporter permease [Chloroflexota bacterium]